MAIGALRYASTPVTATPMARAFEWRPMPLPPKIPPFEHLRRVPGAEGRRRLDRHRQEAGAVAKEQLPPAPRPQRHGAPGVWRSGSIRAVPAPSLVEGSNELEALIVVEGAVP